MAQHTPGPWKAHIYQTHYVITAPDGPRSVMIVKTIRHPAVLDECWERQKADARLMAAAPELLEACEAALDFLVHGDPDKAGDLVEAVPDMLRAAIGKAKGALSKAERRSG